MKIIIHPCLRSAQMIRQKTEVVISWSGLLSISPAVASPFVPIIILNPPSRVSVRRGSPHRWRCRAADTYAAADYGHTPAAVPHTRSTALRHPPVLSAPTSRSRRRDRPETWTGRMAREGDVRLFVSTGGRRRVCPFIQQKAPELDFRDVTYVERWKYPHPRLSLRCPFTHS